MFETVIKFIFLKLFTLVMKFTLFSKVKMGQCVTNEGSSDWTQMNKFYKAFISFISMA